MKSVLLVLGSAVLFSACNNSNGTTSGSRPDPFAAQRSLDSLKLEMAKKSVIDSMNQVNATAAAAQKEQAPRVIVHHDTRYVQSAPAASSAPAATTTTAAAQPAGKRKWSPTAKGAVIGAGSGAVIGALADKNHLEGGVVGGALGAGAGAGIGAIIKKSKENKAAREAGR